MIHDGKDSIPPIRRGCPSFSSTLNNRHVQNLKSAKLGAHEESKRGLCDLTSSIRIPVTSPDLDAAGDLRWAESQPIDPEDPEVDPGLGEEAKRRRGLLILWSIA